ncbi:MAG: DUF4169 family protein [Pseudomonadota bacterium]
MSKIVNLGRVRKARARDAARTQADANALKFGRSKSEKAQDRDAQARSKRGLDDHKRE